MYEEQVSFRIAVSATFDKISPTYSIWINDDQIHAGEGLLPDRSYCTEFERQLSEGNHLIKIATDECIQGSGMINVDHIAINGKDLDNHKLYLLSHYVTALPHEIDGENTRILTNCVNLGWSGIYYIPISVPLVYWFLEKYY